ncbi:Maltose permease MAL31 like protein [Verticillium longisporum]|nr:Maltose permease MAL31 like protein [Verticillium longisporum]
MPGVVAVASLPDMPPHKTHPLRLSMRTTSRANLRSLGDAQAATTAEQETPLRQALRENWKAVLCLMLKRIRLPDLSAQIRLILSRTRHLAAHQSMASRLPETQGRSYEELDLLFHEEVPARKFKLTRVDPYAEGDRGLKKIKAKCPGEATFRHRKRASERPKAIIR